MGHGTLFFLLPPFNLLRIWNDFGMDKHPPLIVSLYFLWVSLSLLFLLTSFSFGMDGRVLRIWTLKVIINSGKRLVKKIMVNYSFT
jgi:hypothetical protein